MEAEGGSHRPVVLSVVGTRPEAIKMAPLVRALAAHATLDARLILTGQHQGLADQFAFLAPSSVLQLELDVRNRGVEPLRDLLHEALCGAVAPMCPDLVLVQGDTASACAGALAARDCNIAVGHVEAGLRTHDDSQPYPEEGYRRLIDSLSTLLFAPTVHAAANLGRERLTGSIHVTGNTGIDALFEVAATLPPRSATAMLPRRIFVTCHRKENQGDGMMRVAGALKEIAATLPVEMTLPLHTNRHVRAEIEGLLAGIANINLVEPLSHSESVAEMLRSWLILTDSGGLQEEGAALGIPVLVLREVTERGEAPANIELVGTDPTRIVDRVSALVHDELLHARMSVPSLAFGDGRASARIVDLVAAFLGEERPALAM